MQPSPLSLASTWDLVADDYAIEVAPAFEQFAEHALRLAEVQREGRVLDVATGPGTLARLAAARVARVDAIDFSPSMIASLERSRLTSGLSNLHAQVADGTALPFADAQFEAAFSMFGLMFFPDRSAGFRELARVLKPGGRAVVSSWAPLEPSSLLAAALEVLMELTMSPAARAASEKPRFPLASLESCREEMEGGGFVEVAVHALTANYVHASVEAAVDSFSRSSAPFALTRQRLAEGWAPVEAELKRRLVERLGEGPQSMPMPAYLTVGRRGPPSS